MNVFCDYHHASLFYSLHLLFEKRLGWNLFRPIGMDWAEKGFWKYYPHPETQKQYLGLHQGTLKPASRLNEKRRVEDGIYYVNEPSENFEHKAVTFEKFLAMDWDILIASVPQHLALYSGLISGFKPNAKLIFQMGNEFSPIPFSLARNILSSTAPFSVPDGVNVCFYHQEFDLNVFKYVQRKPGKKIKSFLNWQNKTADADLWYQYKAALPEFEFIQHGVDGDDGVITGTDKIAEAMADSTFIWHSKPGGDGFGHIIHNAFACGRPVIGRFSHYNGKLAGKLLEDQVTGIDLDKRDLAENISLIRLSAQGVNYAPLRLASVLRFKREVDFDAEFEKIKVFLSNLV